MAGSAELNQGGEVFVLGEEEAYKVYLTEKVRRRELTQAQADARLANYHRRMEAKKWGGVAHDARDVGATMTEVAAEMGSWWSKVYFKTYKGSRFIILKGHPGLRETLKGTRYKITNPKFASWQIARADMVGAARKSAIFGVVLVCTVDILDAVLRDDGTLGQCLGHLAVDLPSVAISAAAGVLAQMAVVAGAAALGVTVVATGPLIVGFVVAAAVGWGLGKLDEKYHIADRLGAAMDEAIANFERMVAEKRRDLHQDVNAIIRAFQRARAVLNLLHDADRMWHDITNGVPQLPRWRMFSW